MSEMRKVDVAVIGAGPVGMALASELLRHGLSVRVVDKEPAPKSYSRAPVIWPRTQEALDLMGLLRRWDGHTVPLRRMHVNAHGRPAGTIELDQVASAHPVPLMVGQDVTERILDDHLRDAGAPVSRATEAMAVDLHDTGARITLRGADGAEEVLDAAWVVGCEGAKSRVRDAMSVGWDGHKLQGLMVVLADAKLRWPLPQAEGDAFAMLTEQGYLLALPLPGLHRMIVAVPDTTPPGEEPQTTLDEVARLASEAVGGLVELSDSPWVAAIRYGNHVASSFRTGRALLAGDAAHSIAPLSGQGMNTGIQDAFDLGWKLAYVHKGWAGDELLDSYTADRRPVAERLIHSTDRTFAAVANPGAVKAAILKAVVPAALSLDAVRERMAAFNTEIDLRYSDSPLNDRSHRHAPRPGEHARDGALAAWPDRTPMRLHDALRGGHWTAIAFSGADPAPEDVAGAHARLASLVEQYGLARLQALLVVGVASAPTLPATGGVLVALDAWRTVHDLYGAAGGATLLVRPDGYVAFHRGASEADQAALAPHLAHVLRPATRS